MEKEKFSIYVNEIDIAVSRFDISLNLNKLNGDGTFFEYGEIILSPIHAKLLQRKLEEHVDLYEEHFGEIHIFETKGINNITEENVGVPFERTK